MKKIILLIITSLIFYHRCVMAAGMVDDIRQARQNNKEANIDVSDIVKKHISLSADRSAIENCLINQKFALYNQPVGLDGSQTVVAIYSKRNLTQIGSHDEIRVVLVFVKNKVNTLSAKLILRSL